MNLGKLWIVAVIVLTCGIAGFAQTAPDLEQGMKPYGSYHGGSLDHVSLTNGNLFFEAPLFSYPQRGNDLSYSIVLRYNNKNFSLYQYPCPPGQKVGSPGCPFRATVVFGPRPLGSSPASSGASMKIGFEGLPGVGSYPIDTSLTHELSPIYYSSTSVVMPDGSTHQLVQTDSGMVAIDGSGYFSTGPQGSTVDSHHTTFGRVTEDRNGNQISSDIPLTVWTDTLGRQFPAAPGTAANPASCPVLNYSNQAVYAAYSWTLPAPASGGGSITLLLCYAGVYVHTNFVGGRTTGDVTDVGQTFGMLQSVVYPDNTYWTFQYDAADPNNSASYGYGDLLKVTFPTGGSLSYTWGPWQNTCSEFSRAVTSRTVDANDGTGPHTWAYNNGTVTDPLGNDTVHLSTGLGGFCSLYETQTQYYQGSHTSGTLLKTVTTDYQYTINPYDPAVIGSKGEQSLANSVTNIFPIRATTALPNGLVSKVETDYDTALTYHGPLDGMTWDLLRCPQDPVTGQQDEGCVITNQTTNPVTNYTGSYGKVTATREYDWGQGAPGPLLRQTTYTYQWQNGTNATSYLSNNFLDLPSSVTVYDGASNQVAKTTYAYDETSPASSSISTQHDPAPANGSIRGNQTTVSHWLNTSNSMVSSHAGYFDTGELQSSTDPLGHITTHLYDAAYVGAFSTQTCSPATGGGTVTHCVSGTYDFNSGLLTSLTNENATQQASGNSPGDSAHTSGYGYDQYWRLTSALAPPDPANNGQSDTTSFTYSVSPLMVTRQKSVTASLNDSASAYFDGVGRTFKSTHALSNGTATVTTTFDAAGQTSTVTNPYFTTSDPTYGVTSSQYDGLGRVTQTIKQDGSIAAVQYDQLTAVSPNGNCTVATDEAGKVRKTCADALGRLIEVDEPGAGANGPGTPGSGAISISGTLSVSYANGSVTVTGAEQNLTITVCNDTCIRQKENDPGGTVKITVNGHANSVTYGASSSATTVANALITQINGDSAAFVNASGPSCSDIKHCTISLQARTPGLNYALSAEGLSSDEADGFTSFDATSASGTVMTGGAYDSGALTVTVHGFPASVSYNQNTNNTTPLMAGALAAALNASGSPVSASASGSTITLTAKAVGSITNYAVSGSSSVSFTASSATLSGGTDPGGIYAPLATLYSYDALGNLLRVEQRGGTTDSTQWRVRTFTYNSLSQLLTATNPESGTISYVYDADGNLLQKISPAPNQTGAATQTVSYCYDELHRVTGKGYGAQSCPLATPVVSYSYDSGANAIGKLVSLTDQAGSASYSYDVLGRMSSETRTLIGANNASIPKTLSYEYNLDGSLAKLHYPSGAVVAYTPDSAGRITQAVDSASGINYVTGATYDATSALTGFISGSGGAAAITNAFTYNKRLQPVTMSAATSAKTVLSIGYDFHFGNGDNGNVWNLYNYKDRNRDQTFNYDALNRLISAQNAGIDCTAKILQNKSEYWGNSYSYDAWGNLLGKTVTKCGAENLSLTADAHNWVHASGAPDYQYDAAGNMTYDATAALNYSFDQENRITGAAGYGYIYDGDGNRVEKVTPLTNPTSGTLYWYMTPGIVAESDLTGTLKSEYVFFDGERVARKDFTGGTTSVEYYFSDHLKTASVVTDSAGNIKAESDYYPWGGELQFVNNDSNHYKFTGKERDGETGLDYFGARYYSNGLGRWVTPDKPFADQHLTNPQSWNLYMYVYNSPLRLIDDTGQGAKPADDRRINGVLNRNENYTISQAILASPNYSAWALERETGNDSLSSSLIGVAGEAEISDRLEAQSMFSFTTFQPRPPGGGQPDILLLHANPDSPAVLLDVIGPQGQLGGFTMDRGQAQVYFEVKTSSDFDVLMKGAQQTAATAASIPAGQNSAAVLAIDKGVWENLKKDDQNKLIKAVGGGLIQLHKNLISNALKRAHKLKTDACKATQKGCK